MNILLVVTGGIAAYKAADVIGLFRKSGHDTRVVMTKSALHFIGVATLAPLSKNKVETEDFINDGKVLHVELAKWADVITVVPATYNFIGKIAGGLADDLASTTIAALPEETKMFIAPAMNVNMWQNPILQKNIEHLESLGRYKFILPRTGNLACGDKGEGALARPQDIVKAVLEGSD